MHPFVEWAKLPEEKTGREDRKRKPEEKIGRGNRKRNSEEKTGRENRKRKPEEKTGRENARAMMHKAANGVKGTIDKRRNCFKHYQSLRVELAAKESDIGCWTETSRP